MDRERIKHQGSQPLNGNDAYTVLGIVFDWLEEEPVGFGSLTLLDSIREAGYCCCTTRFGCKACNGRTDVPRNQFESNEPGPNDADKEFLGDRLYVPLPHLQDGHHYEIKNLPSGASAVVIEEGNAEPTEDEIVQQMHTHDSFGRKYAKGKRNDG